jgi:hypothetical protein
MHGRLRRFWRCWPKCAGACARGGYALRPRRPRVKPSDPGSSSDSNRGALRKSETVRRLVALVSLALFAGSGCSGGTAVSLTQPPKPAARLVRAGADVHAKCQATANAVGYPVPCPMRVPPKWRATKGVQGCQLDIIGPGGTAGCARGWRNWAVGSTETADQHLVIVASPRAIREDAKVVNGPAWYPGARVQPLRSLTLNGRRMRAVYVPRETNEGSAFADHVVLI